MKPRILIVYTGGTIGMIENPVTHALEPFNFDHLIENVPKIKMLDYEIDNLQFDPLLDSSNMNPDGWRQIASAIESNYNRYDGFVVLHGTDTMAYTASALSFMCRNLCKPIIITGSQLPIGEVRTDGEENLITALQIAAHTEHDTHLPTIQEVAILFENYLWRGNRATKKSADNFNAFKSYNYPPLAHIGLAVEYYYDALLRPDPSLAGQLQVDYTLDTGVMFLDLHPALTPAQLTYQLATPGVKGIVMRTYGAGNAPSASWFTDAIRQASDRGVVIVNITQCVSGAVRMGRYATSDSLAAAGVISGLDMTSEAALTKLMYLFGQGLDTPTVRSLMLSDLCGEITIKDRQSLPKLP